MPIPGTIEITFHNGVEDQNPTTEVLFDMLKANEAIERIKELGLQILDVVVN